MFHSSRSLALLLWFLAVPAAAQDPPPDAAQDPRPVEEISLEELLNQEVEVAAKTPQTIREAPGVLTVVTREEIEASGARTLHDVLLLVPGFVPSSDVEGAYSFVFRGLNASEGRALVLLDGFIVNDLLYTFPEAGNHYPISQIERIEIIRGPGSAVYGGFAQLTVINIITRGAAGTLKGLAATATVGQHEDAWGRQTLSLQYADRFTDEVSGSIGLYVGQSHRSNKPFLDYYGETYDLGDEGKQVPVYVSLGASWRDLTVRFLFDDYRTHQRDNYDGSTPEPFRNRFQSLFASAEYTLRLGDDLSVTPRLVFTRQKPWEMTDPVTMDGAGVIPYYRKAALRTTATVTLAWDVLEELHVLGGLEGYLEQGKLIGSPALIGTGFQTPFAGKNEVTYENIAAFAQVQHESIVGTLTVGARFESHTEYGESFVPRAALTRVLGPAHVKLLAARAFRAPGLENIGLANPSMPVSPETTTVFELEAGTTIGKHAIVTGNVFDITIDDPIVYLYDEATMEEGYQNFAKTGSRGFELETRVRFEPRAWVNASYSFYSTADKNEVDLYAVPTLAGGVREGSVLGIPKHKLTLLGSIEVLARLRAHPQFVYLSKRAGYLTPYDMDFNLAISDTDPSYLASFFLSYQDLGVAGLDLSVGVHNILDDDFPILQPYLGYHPPGPGPGREYMLRLTWEP